MNAKLLNTPLQLARGHVVQLGDICGSRVECRQGTLWITLDNDRRDVLLEAGESFAVDSRAGALVNALGGPAEFALRRVDRARCAPRSPWAWPLPRLLRALRGALAPKPVGVL